MRAFLGGYPLCPSLTKLDIGGYPKRRRTSHERVAHEGARAARQRQGEERPLPLRQRGHPRSAAAPRGTRSPPGAAHARAPPGDPEGAQERAAHRRRGGLSRAPREGEEEGAAEGQLSRVRFTPEARTDLHDIWDYIARDNVDSASRFTDTIEEKCRLLGASPEIGRGRPELAPDLSAAQPPRPAPDFARPERRRGGGRLERRVSRAVTASWRNSGARSAPLGHVTVCQSGFTETARNRFLSRSGRKTSPCSSPRSSTSPDTPSANCTQIT